MMGKRIGIMICILLLCLAPAVRAADKQLIQYSAWEVYGSEEQLEDGETPEIILRMLDTAYNEHTELAGKRLGTSNKYTRWYGIKGAWCSIFIAWCMDQQDITLYRASEATIKPDEDVFGFKVKLIPPLFDAYEAVERVSAIPRPGYTIFYASRKGLWEMHVGIVRSAELQADGRYLIETIEGNQGASVQHYLYLYDPHAPFQQGNMSFIESAPAGADERLIISPRNSAWCVKGFGAVWK